jgi:alpha/beta superfamily hydrolase
MRSACVNESVVVEAVRFRSDGWLLSGELAYPGEVAPVAAALLVGPHPLLGGTMTNNVVRGVGDGLARRGVVTLRFDYRGVGASEGPAANVTSRLTEFWQTSRVDDEADYRRDAAAAAAFLRRAVGTGLPMARVGYSFGCSLLAELPGVDADAPLALVAPTVGTHAYESFAAVTAPKLVIAPEGDFAADFGRQREWFDRLSPPKELISPRMDGHFFRGHEEWLADTVARFIAENAEDRS